MGSSQFLIRFQIYSLAFSRLLYNAKCEKGGRQGKSMLLNNCQALL